MKNLTDTAQNRLDKYLSQVRASLHTCTGVDADEVESDIRAHIETELEGIDEPVSLDNLESVLKRLGSPTQWVPEEKISWWRKIILRLRTGPEDWRLAYISFGLLILGFVVLPSFVVLIPASFIVARAALSEAADPHELKSQRWLIYPSLIIVYTFISFWLILWPLVLLIPFAFDFGPIVRASYPQIRDDLRYWIMAVSFIIAVSGAWWAVLCAVVLKWRSLPSVLFRPFGDWFNSRLALILLLTGLALMILSLGLGIWYWL
jgi:hypothetical protein